MPIARHEKIYSRSSRSNSGIDRGAICVTVSSNPNPESDTNVKLSSINYLDPLDRALQSIDDTAYISVCSVICSRRSVTMLYCRSKSTVLTVSKSKATDRSKPQTILSQESSIINRIQSKLRRVSCQTRSATISKYLTAI